MSTPGLTRAQAREVDRLALERLGLSGLVLMENAGLLASLRLLELRRGAGAVVLLCGGGNNGGDGLVVARQLDLRGVPVRVLVTHEPEAMSPDARVQARVLQATGLELEPAAEADLEGLLQGASLLVDGLLGTGFQGELRPPLRALLEAVAQARTQHPLPTVALDLPSGLDCDTGQAAPGTLACDRSLTFAARKRAFDLPGSQALTGPVEVLPIGCSPQVLAWVRGQDPS